MAENEEAAQVLRIATARIDHRPSANERVLNTTVKSGDAYGKLMAPTWSMVLAFREKRIDWATYSEKYHDLLRKRYAQHAGAFHELLRDAFHNDDCLVLTCYCVVGPNCDECHRFLMADILEKIALSEGYEVCQEGELERRATPAISPQPTLPGFGAE